MIILIIEKKNKVLGRVKIKGTEWKIILDVYNYSVFENGSTRSHQYTFLSYKKYVFAEKTNYLFLCMAKDDLSPFWAGY